MTSLLDDAPQPPPIDEDDFSEEWVTSSNLGPSQEPSEDIDIPIPSDHPLSAKISPRNLTDGKDEIVLSQVTPNNAIESGRDAKFFSPLDEFVSNPDKLIQPNSIEIKKDVSILETPKASSDSPSSAHSCDEFEEFSGNVMREGATSPPLENGLAAFPDSTLNKVEAQSDDEFEDFGASTTVIEVGVSSQKFVDQIVNSVPQTKTDSDSVKSCDNDDGDIDDDFDDFTTANVVPSVTPISADPRIPQAFDAFNSQKESTADDDDWAAFSVPAPIITKPSSPTPPIPNSSTLSLSKSDIEGIFHKLNLETDSSVECGDSIPVADVKSLELWKILCEQMLVPQPIVWQDLTVCLEFIACLKLPPDEEPKDTFPSHDNILSPLKPTPSNNSCIDHLPPTATATELPSVVSQLSMPIDFDIDGLISSSSTITPPSKPEGDYISKLEADILRGGNPTSSTTSNANTLPSAATNRPPGLSSTTSAILAKFHENPTSQSSNPLSPPSQPPEPSSPFDFNSSIGTTSYKTNPMITPQLKKLLNSLPDISYLDSTDFVPPKR